MDLLLKPSPIEVFQSYLTHGLVFFLSTAAVAFITKAITKALVSTWLSTSLGRESKNDYTTAVSAIAVTLAVTIHIFSVAAALLNPLGLDASLVYSIAASTARLAAIGLAAALSTVICAKVRFLLNYPINFMARNCLILTYFVSTEEEAKRCATVVVSIIATMAFAYFMAAIDIFQDA